MMMESIGRLRLEGRLDFTDTSSVAAQGLWLFGPEPWLSVWLGA